MSWHSASQDKQTEADQWLQCSKELMECSGFKWKEIEEDDIKRSRWVIPLDNESLVKQATRAWVELGIRLAAPTNRGYLGLPTITRLVAPADLSAE